ncbi:MAG: YkgJ family cysteine cluster protein [Deltaproteobacteria bacterium]
MEISDKDCIACGACCMWNPPSLHGCDAEIPVRDKILDEDENGSPIFIMRYNDGKCPYLSKGGCRIYDDRPDACRIFLRGGTTCKRLYKIAPA